MEHWASGRTEETEGRLDRLAGAGREETGLSAVSLEVTSTGEGLGGEAARQGEVGKWDP